MKSPISRSFESIDGLSLEYREWSVEAELGVVVLLHGFPQRPSVWDDIAEFLQAEGYRVLVLTQRGYASTAIARRVRDYRLECLSDDVATLLDAANVPSAHIVGHDWGGAVGWVVASRYANRVQSLTVLSMPHPATLRRAFLTTKQLFRSWYIFIFMIPGLVEMFAKLVGPNFLVRWLQATGLSRRTAQRYVDAMLVHRESLSASLNWYRAFPWNARLVSDLKLITVPTILAWSTGDVAVDGKAARYSASHVSASYSFIELDGLSHWIPEENPELVSRLILENTLNR